MNKIKQMLLFVSESKSPWHAAKVLINCIILTPALVFHELMHLLVIGYGKLCGMITKFRITKLAFFEVTQNVEEGFKTLTLQLAISYTSNKHWARMCSIAPLYGYIFLIIYGIICVHPFLLIYCVYAVRGFFLSSVDIETSENNGCNLQLAYYLRSFYKFINNQK